MEKIFLGLVIGSRASEGEDPSPEMDCTVNWYRPF